jgi:hypothetical protein
MAEREKFSPGMGRLCRQNVAERAERDISE